MKTYTLQQAQQLVADGAVIENDVDNVELLNTVFSNEFELSGKWKYYSTHICEDELDYLLRIEPKIKLSQIQPEPIPKDVLKIVEKYGKDKILTLIEKI